MTRQEKVIVSQGVRFVKLTVLTGATGKVKSSPGLKLGSNFVIRQVSVTADSHDVDREVSVFAGHQTVIDHMPDQQAYETAPLSTPEVGIENDQDAEIFVEVEIKTGGSPAADVIYLVSIDFWEVLPEKKR
ncbi:MAG: hypothetical protein ACREAW_02995 [Nitrososphaera sp.]